MMDVADVEDEMQGELEHPTLGDLDGHETGTEHGLTLGRLEAWAHSQLHGREEGDDGADDPRKLGWTGRTVSDSELIELRAEAHVAREMGIPWQDRGPPGPAEGGPTTWRGQRYKPNTGK